AHGGDGWSATDVALARATDSDDSSGQAHRIGARAAARLADPLESGPPPAFPSGHRRTADRRLGAARQSARRWWLAADDDHVGRGADQHDDPLAEESVSAPPSTT